MGKPKYIYFTDELAEKLSQEENASALICELLRNYYEQAKEEKMTPEELDKKIAMLEIQVEANKKMEELKNA